MDLEGFDRLVNKRIPDFWARREWVLGEEAKVRAEAWRGVSALELRVVLRYYTEAKECYVWGAFLGSIGLSSSAIECWLRLRTGKETGRLKNVIEEAKRKKLISLSMSDELHYVRELLRNPPAHGDDIMGRIGFLGMRRTGPGSWQAPFGRFGLAPDGAARHAFRAFWQLVEES